MLPFVLLVMVLAALVVWAESEPQPTVNKEIIVNIDAIKEHLGVANELISQADNLLPPIGESQRVDEQINYILRAMRQITEAVNALVDEKEGEVTHV